MWRSRNGVRGSRSPGVLLVVLAAACGAEAPAGDAGALMTTERLRALVPVLDGWQRGEVTAQAITTPEAASVATATFTNGDRRMELEISDTGGQSKALESLVSMAGSDINRPVGNGYFKGTTVSGAPAVESWNTQERLGELTVLVRNRYIIHIGGRGLDDATPMRTLAERVALDRLQ